MAKRWSEAELRFLRDNSSKMSVQALADALCVRVDDLEKNRGKIEEAIEHLKRAARKNGGGKVDFLLACCYAQRGEPGSALEHLRRAIGEDQRNRILARNDRDFDPVRDSPEFRELLAS